MAETARLSFEDPALHARELLETSKLLQTVVQKPTLQDCQRALQALDQATLSSFTRVEQTAKEHAAGYGESDLRRLRRQFSSLKNTYMHYDVKENFVEGLQQNAPHGEEERNYAEYTELVQQQGELAKLHKQENEKLREDILELIAEVASSHDAYGQQSTALQAQLQQLAKDVKAEASRDHGPLPDLGEHTGDETSMSERLSEAAAETRNLESSIAATEAEAQELLAAIASEEQELAARQSQAARLEALKSHKEKHAVANARFARSSEWIDEMLQLISKLAGVTLETVDGDMVSLRIHADALVKAGHDQNSSSHLLTLSLHPGRLTIDSAQLSPADVGIKDIVSAAMRDQCALDFVVREVAARLAAADITALKK